MLLEWARQGSIYKTPNKLTIYSTFHQTGYHGRMLRSKGGLSTKLDPFKCVVWICMSHMCHVDTAFWTAYFTSMSWQRKPSVTSNTLPVPFFYWMTPTDQVHFKVWHIKWHWSVCNMCMEQVRVSDISMLTKLQHVNNPKTKCKGEKCLLVDQCH
jgi:hypothetical protein